MAAFLTSSLWLPQALTHTSWQLHACNRVHHKYISNLPDSKVVWVVIAFPADAVRPYIQYDARLSATLLVARQCMSVSQVYKALQGS